jgi:two-component system response regulator HydG
VKQSIVNYVGKGVEAKLLHDVGPVRLNRPDRDPELVRNRDMRLAIERTALRQSTSGMENRAKLSRAALPRQARVRGLIGESAPMQRFYELIAEVGQSTSPILILGETGTGRELVARSIQSTGLRQEMLFVPR